MLDLSYMFKDMTNTERTEERRNRFNGESVMLTKEEAKRHDRIFMDELLATIEDKKLGQGASKHWEEQIRLHPRTEPLETPITDPVKTKQDNGYGYTWTNTTFDIIGVDNA